MRLTVIGHWGAYPGPGEATSCYLLEEGDCRILLDCGSGALALLQKRVALPDLSAVILSHYHADHVADIHCLQYACRIDMDLGRRRKPLPIYGHAQDPAFEALRYMDFTVGIPYDPDACINVGPFLTSFCLVRHPDPCYAMRVSCGKRSLVYTGDTEYFPELADFARGTDLLISESSLYDEYKGRVAGHLTAGEAGAIARDAGAAALLLSHLPHFGKHEDLAKQAAATYAGPIALAGHGLSLTI